MVEKIPSGIKRSLKDKLVGKKVNIAEMVHESTSDLGEKKILFRLPLGTKDGKTKKEHTVDGFVVKGYESAILVQLGQTIGILKEGFYEIDKNFQFTGTEIIWVDNTEFRTKWGVSDVFLKDNITIAAHGSLVIRVNNPAAFLLNVASGKKSISRNQVDEFIHDSVSETYREILGGLTIDEVVRSRQEIKQKFQVKLYDLFEHWGIELITMEIEGMKLPKEFEQLGKMAMDKRLKKEVRTHAKEAELEDHERELTAVKRKKQKIKQQVELTKAQKELTVVERELDKDQLDYEREKEILDAKTEYETAKFKSEAKILHGTAEADIAAKREEAAVAGEVKILETKGNKEAELTEINAHRDIKIAMAKAGMLEKEELEKEKRHSEKVKLEVKISKIKAKMDKFDDMLADGKISEETYKMRISRLENELNELEIEKKSLK